MSGLKPDDAIGMAAARAAAAANKLLPVNAPKVSYDHATAGLEFSGNGSPEGAVTAPVGAIYHRLNGGAGTSFYVKESGSGSTGWIGK